MVEKYPLISKIQKYSTKDGPGIRTTVFFLGCNLNCKWCSNPELISKEIKVLHYQNKCQLCGYCVSKSNNHIKISENKLVIDRINCTNLPELAELCPYEAYEVIGKYYSPKETAEKLLRDEVFYRQSEGGVTFSGGEASLYPEYLLEVAKELKKHDISLALDTAGLWDRKKLECLLPYLDLVLFDVKAYDGELHKKLCGTDNRIILANLRWLVDKKAKVIGRLVLVPEANDDLSDVKKRLDLLESLKIKQVDILYYHRLAVGKYKALASDYPLIATKTCSEEYKNKIKELTAKYSFVVTYSE